MKIFQQGNEVRSVIRFYLRNVRLPEWLEADLRAMVGSVRIGSKRLVEMTRAHGFDVVATTIEEMIKYSDRRTAAEIRALPDGVYTGESWIDSDGQGTHNIWIACHRHHRRDMIYMDYSRVRPAGGWSLQLVAGLPACERQHPGPDDELIRRSRATRAVCATSSSRRARELSPLASGRPVHGGRRPILVTRS